MYIVITKRVCAESSEAYPKAAIQVRNKCLVDRSDLVICCIQHKGGGAYQAVEYARLREKKIIDLADDDETE